MKRLTCEMCGSTDLVKQDGFFVCQTCGTKYSVEEAKKMMIEGTVEVQGTVKTDLSDQINNLLDRVKNFIKRSEWEKAYDYIDKILDLNNACPDAYYYKMLVILKRSSVDNININEIIECDDEEYDEEHEDERYYGYRKYTGEPIKSVFYDEIDNGEFEIALKTNDRFKLQSLQELRVNLGELQSSFWVKDKTLLYSKIRKGKVVIPDGITKIDDCAFYGNEIDELVLADSITEIGYRAFSVGDISKVRWSRNLVKIGESAFEDGFHSSYNNNHLQIELPNSVEFIGKKAFFSSYGDGWIVHIPPKVKILNTTVNIDEGSVLEIDTAFSWAVNINPTNDYLNFDYRNESNIISKSVLSTQSKLYELLKGKNWALYRLTSEDKDFMSVRSVAKVEKLKSAVDLAIDENNFFEAKDVCENILKMNLEDIDTQYKLACCHVLCLNDYDYHDNTQSEDAIIVCSNLARLSEAPQENLESLIKSIITSSKNIEEKHKCLNKNMDLSFLVSDKLYYLITDLSIEFRSNSYIYNAHRISYKLLNEFGDLTLTIGGNEYLNDICIPSWRLALKYCKMVMERSLYDFWKKEVEQDLHQIEEKLSQYDSEYKKQEENSQTGGCYIATCVYGSYDCPQVWTLRRYRDNTLGTTWYGRAFIRIYYAISPTLVKWFGKTKWFKKMWKGKLDKKVKKLNDNGVESTPYDDKKW